MALAGCGQKLQWQTSCCVFLLIHPGQRSKPARSAAQVRLLRMNNYNRSGWLMLFSHLYFDPILAVIEAGWPRIGWRSQGNQRKTSAVSLWERLDSREMGISHQSTSVAAGILLLACDDSCTSLHPVHVFSYCVKKISAAAAWRLPKTRQVNFSDYNAAVLVCG